MIVSNSDEGKGGIVVSRVRVRHNVVASTESLVPHGSRN